MQAGELSQNNNKPSSSGLAIAPSSTFDPEPAPALVIAPAPAQLQPQTRPHTLPSTPTLSLHPHSPSLRACPHCRPS